MIPWNEGLTSQNRDNLGLSSSPGWKSNTRKNSDSTNAMVKVQVCVNAGIYAA